MKKLVSLLLALVMIFTFAACGGTTTATATPAPATEAPAPTEDAAAPTEAPAPAAPTAEEVKGVTIPEFAITVNGVTVDNVAMAAYPIYSVQSKSVNSHGTESVTTYIGFSVKDVLEAAGLTESYVWLEAAADDGYAVNLTDNASIMADTTLIAISKDGTQFINAPWFAPCSSNDSGSFVKNCVALLVNTTEGAPDIQTPEAGGQGTESGATGELGVPDKQDRTDKVTFSEFSFKVNGTDVTNATLEGLSIYKVTVSTVNSKGTVSESTYTGYVLADVLNACGVTEYSTVKAVANDGYETELTAEQAANEFTIVAIEKDGELGEDGTIWVAPCDEESAGLYCKLVVELTAQ